MTPFSAPRLRLHCCLSAEETSSRQASMICSRPLTLCKSSSSERPGLGSEVCIAAWGRFWTFSTNLQTAKRVDYHHKPIIALSVCINWVSAVFAERRILIFSLIEQHQRTYEPCTEPCVDLANLYSVLPGSCHAAADSQQANPARTKQEEEVREFLRGQL